MYYPWWYVPGLTAPMLIAIIAVVHVFVSHYAVGGGILIALENQFAVKTKDKPYRDYWHNHARFFVLLTVAFGAITGVGIWWTIALASPLATEMLIRTFVFGWAIEWVFFIIEITAAFLMYYFWTRLPEKTHIAIAWIYAIAAWISLVLITGITAFMLDSRGLFANWSETGNFWHAFFNLQFLPQTIIRTGASILLASLYVFLHAAWSFRNVSVANDPINSQLFDKIVRR
ncbi:MAG: cytochrome ubiquinol oxidase subunit I, partial [Planctomycetaceae bacterium]|nr:cytochrome ubiquinol oxidase subunit I [Planctomycetaceae bacterium]